jgi:hypothetical protein
MAFEMELKMKIEMEELRMMRRYERRFEGEDDDGDLGTQRDVYRTLESETSTIETGNYPEGQDARFMEGVDRMTVTELRQGSGTNEVEVRRKGGARWRLDAP